MELGVGRGEDWRDRAECRGANLDVFFPLGNKSQSDKDRIQQALAYCAVCPVSEECLAFAVEFDIRDGVWGGETEWQRRSNKQKRKRQPQRQPEAAEALDEVRTVAKPTPDHGHPGIIDVPGLHI